MTMNYRIMQLVRELEMATEILRNALNAGKDLQIVGKDVERRADIVARAIKDLAIRQHNPYFQEAKKLAGEGWHVIPEGKTNFYAGSLVGPAGQRFLLRPSAFAAQALITPLEDQAPSTIGNHINWIIISYLRDLTVELGRDNIATANVC